MTCDSVRDLLVEYLDAGLTADQQAGVDAHMAECADCRALFESARSTVQTLRDAPQVRPAEGGWSRLSARMDETPRVRGIPAWIGAAAAAALLAAAGFLLWQNGEPPRNLDIEVVDMDEDQAATDILATHAASSPLVPTSADAIIESLEEETP
ncbi:MAG: anti-sigma factor family protein [Planctomycetota bacterium]|jgi:predicted anti-sigma-YlaC factor YlaD